MSESPLITRIPDNTNFIQANKFTFVIPTLPFLRYFVTDVNLPGISTSAVRVDSPFADMWRHGDKLVFEPLQMTVLIDEDLRTHQETYEWLQALTKPDNYAQYVRHVDKKISPYHDAILTLNTNAHISNLRYRFTHCHPVSLGGLQFSTSATAEFTMKADITFRYDQYYIERTS